MNFFQHLEGLIINKVEAFKGLWALVKLEAKLAGLNFLPFLTNFALLIVLSFSTWLSLEVLIGYEATFFFNSLLIGILSTVGFNIVAFALLLLRLKKNIKRMSFEKTRSCLSNTPMRGEHELPEQSAGSNS